MMAATARAAEVRIVRLGYHSRLADGIRAPEMQAIAQRAASKNVAFGVTGALTWDGARVVQILEGAAAEVSRLFAAIRVDPRHFAVVPFGVRPIPARRFDGWAMAWVPQEAVDEVAPRGFGSLDFTSSATVAAIDDALFAAVHGHLRDA